MKKDSPNELQTINDLKNSYPEWSFLYSNLVVKEIADKFPQLDFTYHMSKTGDFTKGCCTLTYKDQNKKLQNKLNVSNNYFHLTFCKYYL